MQAYRLLRNTLAAVGDAPPPVWSFAFNVEQGCCGRQGASEESLAVVQAPVTAFSLHSTPQAGISALIATKDRLLSTAAAAELPGQRCSLYCDFAQLLQAATAAAGAWALLEDVNEPPLALHHYSPES